MFPSVLDGAMEAILLFEIVLWLNLGHRKRIQSWKGEGLLTLE